MAEALSKISKNSNFANIDPQKWQQEIRQDISLPIEEVIAKFDATSRQQRLERIKQKQQL